jgi:hypothetical protein
MTTGTSLETTIGPMPATDIGAEASEAPPFTAGGAAFTALIEWMEIGARNMDAMMKSRAILVRGVFALDNASIGVAMMSVEQAMAAAKHMSRSMTVSDWIAAQNCLAKLSAGRIVGVARMLSKMAVQVVDDASVPLTRRMSANFDEIVTTSAA